jgi:hypothetical protein
MDENFDDQREIELTHLSPVQAHLMEVMWKIDSQEEFDTWYDTLPRNLKRQVDSLKYVMVLEIIEPLMDSDHESYAQAQELIQKVMEL